jgi:hypothetical protein
VRFELVGDETGTLALSLFFVNRHTLDGRAKRPGPRTRGAQYFTFRPTAALDWQALLIESKPREIEEHDQKSTDGGLAFDAAPEPLVFVQQRRDVVLPIERDHAPASA